MKTFDGHGHRHRLAALAAGSVTSLALMSAVLLLFAGVEPQVAPLELAAQCGRTGAGTCEAPSSDAPGEPSRAGMPPVR